METQRKERLAEHREHSAIPMSSDAAWALVTASGQPSENCSDSVCEVIREATGESFTRDTLAELGFDPLRSMYLTRGDSVMGAMLIDTEHSTCWRVIVMVVARDLRRCGHGSSALEMLKALARSSAVGTLALDVRVDNEVAIEFYRRHGFAVQSIKSGFYHGIDGYRMCLAL